ncbi:MAG: C40 family peptidase, partial [Eubacterium sp.]|nr:C40 family peptidase [Eubacterium sp.]
MKISIKKTLATGMVFALLLTTWKLPVSDAKTAPKISLDKTSVSLQVKETETLTVKNVSKKDRGKIKWTTSNAKVAAVTVNKKNAASATISAVKKGKASITAKLAKKKATCKVMVKDRTYTSEQIAYDPSWQYAECAKITSGIATLYHVTAKDANHKIICINAGHGTLGGTDVKVPCHPDGSPKIVSGSTQAGATEATAVSTGMTFLDGTPEYVATLKAAMATKAVLLENGYDVLMIRESEDVQLDNIARTLIANNKADCHIAIHYDANVTTRDAGVFFCSIPDDERYKNMEPVKTWWQEHMKLGNACVDGLVEAGLTRKGTGLLDMDLTQTSFSMVPSVDLEVGNQVSLLTDERLSMVANGIRFGLDDYFGFKKIPPQTEPTPGPTAEPTAEEGNLTYQSDVTAAMTKYSYWAKLQKDADKVLMDEKAIREKNQKLLTDSATNMFDLKNMSPAYSTTASDRRDQLAEGTFKDITDRIGKRETIYVNGTALDKAAIDAWFASIKKNITDADVSSFTQKKYAVCTKRADLWMAPNAAPVGWSATDPDDEFMNSSINVNEPFIVDMITSDGKFYHGYSLNCSGWVETDHFAICDDRDTWLAQWDLTGDQVLVVTTSHITLEKSNLDPATSEVDLMLGTQLPLVPRDQLPETIAERGTWYNYVVWLPTRDSAGKFVRSPALISSHHDVSVGFLPMTKANILKIAFSCLGDRYGWGGMLHAMDCSMYTRTIYRCFGLELPRNTTWQRAMPTYKVEFGPLTDNEKKAAISKLPAGALLMFSGHIAMYIGEVDGTQYVISDLGSLSETAASIGPTVSVKSRYCVSINSLD